MSIRTPLALLLLIPLACAPKTQQATDVPAPAAPSVSEPIRFVEDPELEGLRVRLTDADAAPDGPVVRVAPQTTALSPGAAAALLARLPALPDEGGVDFAVRASSRPAPRPGTTASVPFPPDPSSLLPPAVDPGPLALVRRSPQGEVPLAHQLSATFNQPMIVVSSQEEASRVRPVILAPEPDGQWRWVGTRTVLFDPGTRLPMATRYTATVPAGTTSATGETLAEASSWSFATPPARVVQWTPSGGPIVLEPTLVLLFDQAVDRDALMPFLSLKAGGAPHPLRFATPEEINADEAARRAVEGAQPDRWVALRPVTPLKRATGYALSLAAGAPSAEGPLPTTAAQTMRLETFHPLEVVAHRCSWGGECPPESPFWIQFNNPLDEAAFDPSTLQVAPEIEPLSASPSGTYLTVNGPKTGRTTYTVTLPATLTDRFGQTLGTDRALPFRVGPAEKQLRGPSGPMVVLDPRGDPVVPIYSRNHKKLRLRVYRVGPEHWGPAGQWMREYYDHQGRRQPPPGVRLTDTQVTVEDRPDTLVETAIDFAPWLSEGRGQLLVWIEPSKQPRESWRREQLFFWLQATDLGLSAAVDGEELIAWSTALQDGAPAGDVEITIEPDGPTGTSDARGIARLELQSDPEGKQVLVARSGDDVAILPQQLGWWNDYAGWRRWDPADTLRFFTFDDRGLYKPGQTVRVKGWLRRFEPRRGGDIRGLDGAPTKIRWSAHDVRWADIATGESEVSATGGFEIEVELPDDVNLGTGWIDISPADPSGAGGSHRHPVQIQEFRRPEFEVSTSADPGPHVLGSHATVEVAASYFSGGGLAGADTTWRVYASPGAFTPPGRSDWSFGRWVPWWRWEPPSSGAGQPIAEHVARTEGSGEHRLRVDFEAMNPPRPMNVKATATVMDVNRQAWTATSDLVLHPAAHYVGLKTERPFYGKGDPVRVEAIVVDLDGAAVLGRTVEVALARLAWERSGGRWQQVETGREDCTIRPDADGEECTFEPSAGGSYRVTATTRDPENRPTSTELNLWISGGESTPQRGVAMQEATLIPSGQEFAAGDVAEILVQSPFAPAEGLMTLRRSGVVKLERFTMSGSSHVLRIPIEDQHVPDLTVQVDLVGETTRTDDAGEPLPDSPKRPAFASGTLQVQVPPLQRTLSLEVTPQDPELQPGEATSINLLLTDASGSPVSGEVAVVVVDEAVLSLTGYRIPDPLQTFYALRGPGTSDHYLRAMLLLADPATVTASFGENGGGGAPGMDGGVVAALGYTEDDADAEDASKSGGDRPRRASAKVAREPMPEALAMDTPAATPSEAAGPSGPEVTVRTDFRALAGYEPSVATDSDGRARVDLTVPDSLTRYRVMAVAVSGEHHFGRGEATITARKPVQARPSPPRFLNFGDTFEMPVVVQNQTDGPLQVRVAARAVGFELTGPAGMELTVPAGDRTEVRFPAAARRPGVAQYQVVVDATAEEGGSSWADAADGTLPIWTPATSEAFATYGTLDAGTLRQPVAAPEDVWPQFGGLEITTSSTALQALTDAVLYLAAYPFDCSEQASSRILAVAALRDVLAAFEADGLPAEAELLAAVDRDITKLRGRQRSNGGFGLWTRYDAHEWPYVTVHVMHALARAREKGFDVPKPMIDRGLGYLRAIEGYIPAHYPQDTKRTIRAYAVYTRELLGDSPGPKARALYREGGTALPLEAQGWIVPTLHRASATREVTALLRHWDNRVSETAGAANFVTDYGDAAYLLMHSDRRTDGVLLEALLRVDPDSDLIPKVVRGLLAHKKRGRWGDTQENSLILVALDRYFRTFEAETPDFVARVWLGDGYAGDHAFQGRTTELAQIDVPMRWLAAKPGVQDLVLQKDGDDGRLYYRIGMRYAPRSLQLEPADHGFAVQRTYLPVDDDGDVTRDQDGTWRVRAGARVRVRVTLVADSRRYHVALVDPLPAGLEAINPELATSEVLPADVGGAANRHGGSGPWRWWWGSWYEHDNLRDERAEAFASLLWDGVYEYTYVARATTPGDFVVPPPRAEEMYAPETFGRGGTDRLIVE